MFRSVLPVAVGTLVALGTAQAETCYNLAPFVDVVRVNQTTTADESVGGTHTGVVGNWFVGGTYSLPVTGSLDTDEGGLPRLGLHGTQHTASFFGGNADCVLDGNPGGAWTAVCDAPGLFGPVSGSPLAIISCDTISTAPVAGTPVGSAAKQSVGQPR